MRNTGESGGNKVRAVAWLRRTTESRTDSAQSCSPSSGGTKKQKKTSLPSQLTTVTSLGLEMQVALVQPHGFLVTR